MNGSFNRFDMMKAEPKQYASPLAMVLDLVSENFICDSQTTKTIVVEELTETPYNWEV